MKEEYAKELLRKTTENYNLIAKDFSRTRRFIWEDIRPLSDFTLNGERVLDMGCGNGRLLQIFKEKEISYTGVDISEKLIEEAKIHYPDSAFYVYDALKLPLPTNSFDKVYSIAVLHHIPSYQLRLKFLKEAKRVLKQDGLLVLTVWDVWNGRGIRRLAKNFFLKIFGISKLDFKDIMVPWGKTCQRYIHVFTKKELEKLLKEAGFNVREIGVLGEGKKNKNYYVIAGDPTP